MVIRQEQLDSVARSIFFSKLRQFLRERVRRPELLLLMDDRRAMYALWLRLEQRCKLGSEYRAAIFLSYGWFQHCSGLNAEQGLDELVAQQDAEFRAKSYLEKAGMLRFSEFDLASDRS